MALLSSSQFNQLFEALPASGGTADEIVSRVEAAGGHLNRDALRGAIDAHHLRDGAISTRDWRLLLALQLGDQEVKAREAFSLLDSAGAGTIELKLIKRLIQLFEVSEQTADAIAIEMARDGSERIDIHHLLDYLPQDFESHPRAYAGGHRTVEPPRASSLSERWSRDADKPDASKQQGTSPLQMQIGWFRLIQGAAYRSFRESYSANSETHLRAYDLPYTIPDFVRFVNAAVDLYLSLGIVEPGAEEPFETLRNSVNGAEADLRERMANWNSSPKTDAMLEAEGRLEHELQELDHHHQIVGVVLEVLLTAALNGHDPETVTHEDLQRHELNRLRQLDDHQEATAGLDPDKPESQRPYHDSWQRVIVDADDQRYAGSVMPTAYWYDEFMPLLLRASSVLTQSDINEWDDSDDEDLNAWFAERHASGEFRLYGHATDEAFQSRPLVVKKELRRAWELTRHYLNGVQKRREREEFGREDGFLCQYVAFLDLHVGRHDVEASQMRVSFPYYIGPATWRFMHTSAELIAAQPKEKQQRSVKAFKVFFAALATMYPGP